MIPLAEKMRPKSLEDFVGQKQLSLLYEMINNDAVSSMIFWGPPGVGKTTLAKIIAHRSQSYFVEFSAVTSGIKEIKKVMEEAKVRARMGQNTILFVDEIHRFNKAQQDAFLPFVENGSIVLIGATTENPSFEINNALLSRCRVFVLESINKEDIVKLLNKALVSEDGYGNETVNISDKCIDIIAEYSGGDVRFAYNTLEMLMNSSRMEDGTYYIDEEKVYKCLNRRSLNYDRHDENHYNMISALHKSMRNSDVDASIYYLARMIEGGEDPLYIARRIVRFASEDIGMADSRALEICIAAYDACHYLGYPECNVHLTHAVTYCALAPKSNSLYMAYEAAKKDAIATQHLDVPLQIRNAPTRLMKELGYGEGYEYAHDNKYHVTAMSCMPDELKNHHYYHPGDQGTEQKVQIRMKQIEELRRKIRNEKQ